MIPALAFVVAVAIVGRVCYLGGYIDGSEAEK